MSVDAKQTICSTLARMGLYELAEVPEFWKFVEEAAHFKGFDAVVEQIIHNIEQIKRDAHSPDNKLLKTVADCLLSGGINIQCVAEASDYSLLCFRHDWFGRRLQSASAAEYLAFHFVSDIFGEILDSRGGTSGEIELNSVCIYNVLKIRIQSVYVHETILVMFRHVVDQWRANPGNLALELP